MRTLTTFLFSLSYMLTYAQEPNLVPNGGFEEYYECPTQISPPDGPSEINKLLQWHNPTNGSPDYFNACANSTHPYVGIPAMECDVNMTHTGNGMIGQILYSRTGSRREYVSVELKEHMVQDKYYEVELFLSKSCKTAPAIKSIGIFFSEFLIETDTGNFPLLPFTPQVTGLHSDYMQEAGVWCKISSYYISNGGEKFIIITRCANRGVLIKMI